MICFCCVIVGDNDGTNVGTVDCVYIHSGSGAVVVEYCGDDENGVVVEDGADAWEVGVCGIVVAIFFFHIPYYTL